MSGQIGREDARNTKIDVKSAGHGESMGRRRDWAFYPHTNYQHTNGDVLAVGIYLDDCDEENGPMPILPGARKGPVHNHRAQGYFCGAISTISTSASCAAGRP